MNLPMLIIPRNGIIGPIPLTDPITGASLKKTYIQSIIYVSGCDYYVSELEESIKHGMQNHRLAE